MNREFLWPDQVQTYCNSLLHKYYYLKFSTIGHNGSAIERALIASVETADEAAAQGSWRWAIKEKKDIMEFLSNAAEFNKMIPEIRRYLFHADLEQVKGQINFSILARQLNASIDRKEEVNADTLISVEHKDHNRRKKFWEAVCQTLEICSAQQEAYPLWAYILATHLYVALKRENGKAGVRPVLTELPLEDAVSQLYLPLNMKPTTCIEEDIFRAATFDGADEDPTEAKQEPVDVKVKIEPNEMGELLEELLTEFKNTSIDEKMQEEEFAAAKVETYSQVLQQLQSNILLLARHGTYHGCCGQIDMLTRMCDQVSWLLRDFTSTPQIIMQAATNALKEVEIKSRLPTISEIWLALDHNTSYWRDDSEWLMGEAQGRYWGPRGTTGASNLLAQRAEYPNKMFIETRKEKPAEDKVILAYHLLGMYYGGVKCDLGNDDEVATLCWETIKKSLNYGPQSLLERSGMRMFYWKIKSLV